MPLLGRTQTPDVVFGPPYAVVNLSKVGLRYFRLFLQVSRSSKEEIIKKFIDHPNVGWVLEGEGWFNLAIGLWATDNTEINDIGSQIRVILKSGDVIVYQSELTSLNSFGTHGAATRKPMPIVDSTLYPTELSPLELDYIKIVTLDSSLSDEALTEILAVPTDEIKHMREKLFTAGILVGEQDRINYGGRYYKIFVDTASTTKEFKIEDFFQKLWQDPACIYVERANGKYDLEFELILENKKDLNAYLQYFGEYQTAFLTNNLYTNLYPLGKIANLKNITDTLSHQQGSIIDFRNSKLWYLNHRGTQAYLDIYENKEYWKVMEKAELDLFDDITSFIKEGTTDVFNIVDLGSGNGEKAKDFIEKLGSDRVKAYYPVDIQPIELAEALKAHRGGTYAKHPTLLDFENVKARFPLKTLPGEQQLYLLFGGTYGNFPASDINSYVRPIVANSFVLIAMPIVAQHKSDNEIMQSYATQQYENMAFGPLAQMGFTKEQFEPNPQHPTLYVQFAIEERRLVSSFVLVQEVTIAGRLFSKGSRFKMITSWKPTMEEFKNALEQDFHVEKIFSNQDMAIALITGRTHAS